MSILCYSSSLLSVTDHVTPGVYEQGQARGHLGNRVVAVLVLTTIIDNTCSMFVNTSIFTRANICKHSSDTLHTKANHTCKTLHHKQVVPFALIVL